MTVDEASKLTPFEKELLDQFRKLRLELQETNELLKTLIAMDA